MPRAGDQGEDEGSDRHPEEAQGALPFSVWDDLAQKSALQHGLRQDIEGLFSYHHERLFSRFEQRLSSFQEELLDRLVQPASPSKYAAAPASPFWPASVEDADQTSRRPSLGTELLLGSNPPAVWPDAKEQAEARGQVSQAEAVLTVPSDVPARVSADRLAPPTTVIAGHVDARPAPTAIVATQVIAIPSAEEAKRVSEATVQETRVSRLVHSRHFEVFFGFCIVANAIFIGVQTDFLAQEEVDPGQATIFDIVSNMFAFVFTGELVLKVYCHRWKFFTAPDKWHWNILDLIVVVTSLVEAGATFALGFGSHGRDSVDSRSTSQFRILRIVRISRVIKVVRMIRVIRFIRALRTMVHQLMSTMKPLLWAVLLLCLIMYLFAILFTQSVLIHRTGGGETTPALLEYWSTLPRSMISLFMSVTNGVSWGDTVAPLSIMGPLPVLLFVGYIAFVQFAVLNILTGVFCQNAIDSASHDQEMVAQDMLANKQMYIHNMQQLFKEFDADKDGSVTVSEFMAHLNDESVRAYFDSLDLDTSDVCTLFRLLDTADHNELELDEFVSGCMRLKGNAKGVDMAKLSYAQSAMARRLARFMERTDAALLHLMERAYPDKAEPARIVNANACRSRPPKEELGAGDDSTASSHAAREALGARACGMESYRRCIPAAPASIDNLCL